LHPLIKKKYEKETIHEKYQQTFILKIRGAGIILYIATKGVKRKKALQKKMNRNLFDYIIQVYVLQPLSSTIKKSYPLI